MRIPFTLEKFLANPTLTVVTRKSDKPVKIVSTDANNKYPVIAIVEGFARQYDANGTLLDYPGRVPNVEPSSLDLIIEDGTPEKELTQFEHELGVFIYGDAYDNPKTKFNESQKGFLKMISRDILLPLAKKDLETLGNDSK